MIVTSPKSWKTWALAFPKHADESTPAYKSPFRVVNKTPDAAEILIYDQIGRDFWSGEGVAANDFAELLADIDPKAELTVGINSPGGNVWDGLAIFNMLSARKAKVTTRNDGMAASIASIILQAGHERQTNSAAMVMIHKAWGLMIGNSDDAAAFKAELDKHDQVLAEILSNKSGRSMKEITNAMSEETFFTGNEAKEFGLVDTVIGRKADTKNLTASAVNAGRIVAALHPTTPKIRMNTDTPTAPAANNPPAPTLDLGPVITAINGLRDDIKATRTANSLPGTEPITATRVENLGNPLVERYNSLAHDRVAQAKLARSLYNDVRKQLMIAGGCGDVVLTADNRFDFNDRKIMNANTVDAALANTILSGDFVTTMRTYCAPWTGFTRRVEMSPVSKRQTLEVPLVSSAGSMQTNATNYETGDTTLAPIAIVTSEYSKSFHITRPQTNLGLQLAAHAPTHAKILGEGLSALFTAEMTNANFGADVVIGAASDFAANDLPAILALGKNYTKVTLVLDGGHLAYLLPTSHESFKFGEPGAYGFDGGIYKNNLWTSAATDIAGLVCGADAICSAWGQADGLPAGEAISQTNVDVEGFPFSSTVWFSRATREVWGSFQIVGGVKAGDKTQAEVLTTQ